MQQQRPRLASSLLIRRLAALGLAVIVTTGLLAAPSQAATPSPAASAAETTTDLGVTLGLSSDIALPASVLTLTTSPRVLTGMEVVIFGRLTRADGSALGAQPLTVTRRLPGGTDEALDGVTTAPDGTLIISDQPPGVGEVIYTVAWAGDDTARASSTVAVVTVRHRSSLTMTGPALGTTGTEMHFSGVVETGGNPPPPGSTLTVQRTVQIGDSSTSTMLSPVPVSDDGTFTFTDMPATSGRYFYVARWAGNGMSGPARSLHEVIVNDG
ncbi:hypothetical protein AB0F17_58320 [Nonomuraea sp. NPDC026600]|uniref:hypothetical protein n=1 Tax=Nonomuraea sp. NPDC026600 TaxID=3155363 RepID=UPI003402DFA7